MQSEHRTKSTNGQAIWLPIGDRANHLWDAEIMGLVPAMMAKLIGRGKNKNAKVDETQTETKPEETA
jgi:hypothetical protein